MHMARLLVVPSMAPLIPPGHNSNRQGQSPPEFADTAYMAVLALLLLLQLRIPRVVGMLGSGLLLANVPGGVVAAFPAKWGVQMRAAALATIFLRCGLELEFKVTAGLL
jgi:hypothetical protein